MKGKSPNMSISIVTPLIYTNSLLFENQSLTYFLLSLWVSCTLSSTFFISHYMLFHFFSPVQWDFLLPQDLRTEKEYTALHVDCLCGSELCGSTSSSNLQTLKRPSLKSGLLMFTLQGLSWKGRWSEETTRRYKMRLELT